MASGAASAAKRARSNVGGRGAGFPAWTSDAPPPAVSVTGADHGPTRATERGDAAAHVVQRVRARRTLRLGAQGDGSMGACRRLRYGHATPCMAASLLFELTNEPRPEPGTTVVIVNAVQGIDQVSKPYARHVQVLCKSAAPPEGRYAARCGQGWRAWRQGSPPRTPGASTAVGSGTAFRSKRFMIASPVLRQSPTASAPEPQSRTQPGGLAVSAQPVGRPPAVCPLPRAGHVLLAAQRISRPEPGCTVRHRR